MYTYVFLKLKFDFFFFLGKGGLLILDYWMGWDRPRLSFGGTYHDDARKRLPLFTRMAVEYI